MPRKIACLIYLLLLFGFNVLVAQQSSITLEGVIFDEDKMPVYAVAIIAEGTPYNAVSDSAGYYELKLPTGKTYTIIISRLGYESQYFTILSGESTRIKKDFSLKGTVRNLEEVSIYGEKDQSSTMSKIEVSSFTQIPNPTGNVEVMLKTYGAASRDELSSQYSVRGGNFDENLVYVNDIEIFRPFLIRSGQQEGLSFANSEMISSLQFSPGGFEASFGDKMSSVLDIKYRKPTEFKGHFSLSLLGGSLQFEGLSKNQKVTYNTGLRYKSTKYLLGTLDTEGEYNTTAFDVQTYITYALNKRHELSILGNYSYNQYEFIPETSETEFGTWNMPLHLKVNYEGMEDDRFNNGLAALTYNYKPNNYINLKLLASGFITSEYERFDILGEYLLNELDNVPESDTYGDSIYNLGIGTQLNHCRNQLYAQIYSLTHRGSYIKSKNSLKWGLTYQMELIDDQFNEWVMLDSAGYSIPYSGTGINLQYTQRGIYNSTVKRYTGFVQNTTVFNPDFARLFLTAGIRYNYNDLNNQFLLSPRASLGMKPYWKSNVLFRLSTGYYYQPPFYKEFKNYDGTIINDVKAQESIHIILGSELNYKMWDRPFKFTGELFYKYMDNLIPYKLKDVRIQYYPEYTAHGYAYGIDLKLNGEFVKDAESWVSMTLLQAKEDIYGDYYYRYINSDGAEIDDNTVNNIITDSVKTGIGYFPMPNSQALNFGLFFQDYLPTLPDYKVHLQLLYSTRIPFSLPGEGRFDQTYHLPAYKRVDVGFSKSLIKENGKKKGIIKNIRSASIGLEIFNLLNINNVVAYNWVSTVENQAGLSGQFAVPMYLTSRRINVKLTVDF